MSRSILVSGSHKLAVLAIASLGGLASAAVIDNYNVGPLADSGSPLLVLQTQDGLNPFSVVGGGRRITANYGGEFALGAAPGGRLVLDHDRSIFEVAQIQYGSFSASLDDLNADLTDAGVSDRILINVVESTPDSPDLPMAMSLVLSSGVGTDSPESGGVSFALPTIDGPYVLSIPFDSLSGQIDLTDVDGLSFSYFLENRGRLVFDEVRTNSLPTGDLDASGRVGLADYDAFVRFYGVEGPLSADANADGIVNAADYTVWRDNLPIRRAVSTPEPTSLVVLLLAGLAPLSRFRRPA